MNNNTTLSSLEQQRYARQISLPGVGIAGQERLKNARVMIIGMGGLGCPIAQYLVGAGVGTIGLVDDDVVSLSNLQRQLLYSQNDVGALKVDAARRTLSQLNSNITIRCHPVAATLDNVEELIATYDVIIDGCDNLHTRYLLSDACVKSNKPFSYGAVYRFSGQSSFFIPGHSCYRCLFPEQANSDSTPDCNTAGVLGVLPGVIGILQATEVLKYILNQGENLNRRLLQYDALKLQFSEISYKQKHDCVACSKGRALVLNAKEYNDQTEITVITPGAYQALDLNTVVLIDLRDQSDLKKALHIPLGQLEAKLAMLDEVSVLKKEQPFVLICQRGIRATQAAKILANAQFSNVCVLQGGLDNLANHLNSGSD